MRRVILCVMLAALLVIPAAAQGRAPVPDIVRYAEYAPEGAAMYAAIRMDAGFRETMNGLLARLEPLIGDTDINDFFEEIFNEEELFSFAGDALVLTVLSPDADFDDLLDEDSPVAITFGIKDFDAARTFIEESLGETLEERNGWLVYGEEENAFVLLRGDIMIISPYFEYMNTVLSGDYGKLTNDARFQDTLARLPLTQYDVIVYAQLGEILAAQRSRPSTPPIGREDDTTSDTGRDTTAEPPAAAPETDADSALFDALGSVVIGGVNVGGRDLLLDAALLYGDADALTALGFDVEELGAPAVDLTFASRVAADTQFYAQSTNLGGLLDQMFSFLNIAGAMMEDDASTRYFGLEGYIDATMGARLKAAMGFGLAAATGLNIDSDVIDVLEGDFALYTSIHMDETALQVPSLGIVMDESGQGENYATAVASSLDRAGYPITRVPLRDGSQAIDLSALTDPFVASMLGRGGSFDVSADPRFDVWFGTSADIIAFGTAPSVQFALLNAGESLADTAAYQHAVESVFLDGAQGILFVNTGALESLAFNEEDQALVRLVESVSASAYADFAGLTGRFAVSLK